MAAKQEKAKAMGTEAEGGKLTQTGKLTGLNMTNWEVNSA
jgi:hypothetical protein